MPLDRGTILVVDDQPPNRLLLDRLLTKHGYTVVTAENGEEALRIVAERPVALILLDVMMPGVDGLEVLRRLRAEHAPTELPVIMVTARDEAQDIVHALSLGANDYITKPIDFPVVLARVETQMSLHEANEALASAHERLERDLAAAARIQQALLPSAPPDVPGATFAYAVMPCDELAGDTLNLMRLDDRHVGMSLIDVSGHGVSAALLSVTLNHLLAPMPDNPLLYDDNGGGPEPRTPVGVATKLNERFQLDLETTQYFTLAYGVLETTSRVLRYVCAGHPGPVHLSGATARHRETADLPVGWVGQPSFHEHRLDLEPGDRVYFFSDGLAETRGQGEPLGVSGICRLVEETRTRPLAESVERLSAEASDRSHGALIDDVSILALEIAADASDPE
jgi:sigma-B regulation protein RsbU (phosphoserine phosphatase)